MKSLILSLFLFVANASYAQFIRCASDSRAQQNPELHELIRQKAGQLKGDGLRIAAVPEIIRIPVVVHVIHNVASGRIEGSNISDEQIYSQIGVLNEDYRRKQGTPGDNAFEVGADMQVEFFLAYIGPNGEPSSGINRVYSSKRSFNIFSETLALSDLSYWDANRYLNIWVTTISGGYLGYAEFPIGKYDGLEAEEIDERIDGVFVDYRAFGRQVGSTVEPYHWGRTATHEVGHWLGLIHTWGDARCGTDFCDDTPPAEAANNSLFCTPVYSNCGRETTRNMIENFMDYTVDSCMNVFTQDQKARVRAILEISTRRQNLLANADLFETVAEPIVLKILGNPVEGPVLKCKILVNQPLSYTLEVFDELGRALYSADFTNSLNRMVEIPKSTIGTGVRHLRIRSKDIQLLERIISL